jgi:methylmalonyl-CoA mutase cobalamin-binding domain/chain
MKTIRVLLAKVGLDGHDRGLKVIAHHMAAAGMEVTYLGLRATPEEIAAAARKHEADVVGLSFLAGDHLVQAPRVSAALARVGMADVLLIVGGVVPSRDVALLQANGVRRVFLPGTPPPQIVQFIQTNVKAQSAEGVLP